MEPLEHVDDAEGQALRELSDRVDAIKMRVAVPGVVASLVLGVGLAIVVGGSRFIFALAFVAGFGFGVAATSFIITALLHRKVPRWLLELAKIHRVPPQEMLPAVDLLLPSLHLGDAMQGMLTGWFEEVVDTSVRDGDLD